MMIRNLACVVAGTLWLSSVTLAAPMARPPQPPHDIEWYSQHPTERHATDRRCHSSHAFDNSITCKNSETGGVAAWERDAWAAGNKVQFTHLPRSPARLP